LKCANIHASDSEGDPVQLNSFPIRPMLTSDADGVLAVQRAAFTVESRLYDDPSIPPLMETLDDLLADLAGCLGLVAVDGDRIIGSVRVRVAGPRLHIGRLAVEPGHQGRGLGASLLARAEQVAPAQEAWLFTGHRSVGNLRLYARAGYVEQRRARVDERVTLVHLCKQLG
jgi:predicted N-acetyltransferase YhbS